MPEIVEFQFEEKPDVSIDMEGLAFDFSGTLEQIKALKKQATESGKAITVSMGANGKFQFVNSGWKSTPTPDNFTNALNLCIGAIYGDSLVTSHYDSFYDRMSFTIKVYHEKVAWVCVSEYFYDKPGNAFTDLLKAACNKFDNCGSLMQYKLPKIHMMHSDDPISAASIEKVPFSGSFEKLKKSLILPGMAKAIQDGQSVEKITLGDLKGILWKVERLEESMNNLAAVAETAKSTMELLAQKLGPPTSWNGPMSGAGYVDSGEILKQKFPGLKEKVKYPCKCQELQDTIHNIIIHLNDRDFHLDGSEWWTREQIADWLETLDVKLELKEN